LDKKKHQDVQNEKKYRLNPIAKNINLKALVRSIYQ